MGAASDARKAAQHFSRATRDALKLLDSPPASGTAAVAAEEVKAALSAAVKVATRVGLMFGVAPPPSSSDAISLISEFEQQIVAACLLLHGASHAAGPTLLAARLAATSALVASANVLVSSAVDKKADGNRGAALARIVGKIEEDSEGVQRALVDNRCVIGKSIVAIAASMKDVIREIGEMEGGRCGTEGSGENSGAAREEAGGGDKTRESVGEEGEHGNDDEDGDSDGEVSFSCDDELSQEERELVVRSRQLCGATLGFVKSVVLVVARSQEPSGQMEVAVGSEGGDRGRRSDLGPGEGTPNKGLRLEDMEGFLSSCQAMSLSVDEIGASLYPPQETENIQEHARRIVKLMEGIVSIVDECIQPSFEALLSSLEENARLAKDFFT